MEDTSERIITEKQRKDEADYYVYLLHIVSYKYATTYASGKLVLDYGCGTGYGTQILSTVAERVIGIDLSSEAINYAQNNYNNTNIQYFTINKEILPFPDKSFDLITSFQVIEHIYDTTKYLNEIKRVLKPDGFFLLTTPDRETRLFSFQKPWNYFHIIEYSIDSLKSILLRYFNEISILKIGGDERLVAKELKRRKFTKWITLPFTLSFYPDSLRRSFLGLLKKIYYTKPQVLSQDNYILQYTANDIIIDNLGSNHTDLMAICNKKQDE